MATGMNRIVPLVRSLLDNAGCSLRTTASFGIDVKDVVVPQLEEPVDEPGTTIGTYFSMLHF